MIALYLRFFLLLMTICQWNDTYVDATFSFVEYKTYFSRERRKQWAKCSVFLTQFDFELNLFSRNFSHLTYSHVQKLHNEWIKTVSFDAFLNVSVESVKTSTSRHPRTNIFWINYVKAFNVLLMFSSESRKSHCFEYLISLHRKSSLHGPFLSKLAYQWCKWINWHSIE